MSKVVQELIPLVPTFQTPIDPKRHQLYQETISNLLVQILPSSFCIETGSNPTAEHNTHYARDSFHALLPLITWSKLMPTPTRVSFFLLCKQRTNATKFFYEMITRWLVPGKSLNALMFFTVDFYLTQLGSDLYTIAELTLLIDQMQDLATIERNLPIIETELRLGIVSFYHASRILEIKGLSSDSKTAMIQEHIAYVLDKRPQAIDQDIFSEMQHFLVMCGDVFKSRREYRHISRIICVHYLFRKDIRKKITQDSQQHYLDLKTTKARLHKDGKTKIVLGIILALNFLNDHELFDKSHLLKAIQQHIPQAKPIEDSFFMHRNRSDKICTMYLEVEKSDGIDFSIEEVNTLRQYLPVYMQSRIERRQQPLFMPRNEEEVMRHIIVLSSQLKAANNIPQVIISFDRQTDEEIIFMVILLRPLRTDSLTLEELFKQSNHAGKFLIDQIRTVGFIRRKYPKEANVFQVHLEKQHFLREDHSVDLSKARQSVALQLTSIIGEFRDYNGGMISKEHELFCALKNLLVSHQNYDEFLLENFFYALTPVVMRSVLPVTPLKEAFLLFLEALRETEPVQEQVYPHYCFFKQDKEYLYLVVATTEQAKREKIDKELRQQHRLLRIEQQVIYSFLQLYKVSYSIYIYHLDESEKKQELMKALQQILERTL